MNYISTWIGHFKFVNTTDRHIPKCMLVLVRPKYKYTHTVCLYSTNTQIGWCVTECEGEVFVNAKYKHLLMIYSMVVLRKGITRQTF